MCHNSMAAGVPAASVDYNEDPCDRSIMMGAKKKKTQQQRPDSISREQRIEIFAQAVVANKTQSDAYRLAYPASLKWKNESVHVRASYMAADGKVLLRIQELKYAQLERHGASIDRVIQELTRVAFLDPRRFYDAKGKLLPVHLLPDDIAAALGEFTIEQTPTGVITKKIKAVSKLHAVELLGKWFKMWTDKHELGGIGGGKIQTDNAHHMDRTMSEEELGRQYDIIARRG